MARITSDIFDSYEQIAIEKGLVKKAAPEKESKELKKYKTDAHARMGSDDIKTIEKLYDVKPDSIYEYERNILEVAHPTPYVEGPAYDRLNALIENVNERQDIISNIVMKPTDGNLTNHRYAEKELLMELVKIANDMDNRDQEELRVLADSCISDLKKKAFSFDDVGGLAGDVEETGKGALVGAVIGGLIGTVLEPGGGTILGAKIGAGAGGLMAALFKTTPEVLNIKDNIEKLLSELNDLKESLPEDQLIGSFEGELNILSTLTGQYTTLIDGMKNEEINKQTSSPQEQENANKVSMQMTEEINKIEKYFSEFNRRADSGEFADAVKHNALLTVWHKFVNDDIQDVSGAIESLDQSIKKFKESIKNLHGAVNAAAQPAAPATDKGVPSPVVEQKTTPLEKNQEPADNNEGMLGIAKYLGYTPTKLQMEFLKSIKD